MPSVEGPPRPDEAASQRRSERRVLPVVAVVGVIALVTLGARGAERVTVGPVSLGDVVTIHPEPGWAEDEHQDDDGVHQVLLRKGSVGLFVVAIEGQGGTAAALGEDYARDGLDAQFARVTIGRAGATTLDDGTGGVRYGYVGVTGDGVSIEGVVIAVVGAGDDGVIFDGFAPEGDLASAIQELGTMIHGAEVG